VGAVHRQLACASRRESQAGSRCAAPPCENLIEKYLTFGFCIMNAHAGAQGDFNMLNRYRYGCGGGPSDWNNVDFCRFLECW